MAGEKPDIDPFVDPKSYLSPEDASSLVGPHRLVIEQYMGEGVRQPANLIGIGIGVELKAGEPTGQKALVAMVERKLPPDELAKNDLLPKTAEGVRLDVVEVGQIFAGVGMGTEVMPPATRPAPTSNGAVAEAPVAAPQVAGIPFATTLRRKMRPACGGVSVGHYKITAGTIATGVYRILPGGSTNPPRPGFGIPGAIYVLSNNHVLANSNDARLGDPILQPGPFDRVVALQVGDTPIVPAPPPFPDLFARLSQFVPIQFFPPIPLAVQNNIVDCAIGVVDLEDLDREVFWIGEVRGWRLKRRVAVGTSVQKTGRTTGWTTGRITAINATVDVNYGGGRVARFRDQIMTTRMSMGGDSGSLLQTWDNVAVGLLFAGSSLVTIFNQIENVRAMLGVEVAQQII